MRQKSHEGHWEDGKLTRKVRMYKLSFLDLMSQEKGNSTSHSCVAYIIGPVKGAKI